VSKFNGDRAAKRRGNTKKILSYMLAYLFGYSLSFERRLCEYYINKLILGGSS
jgi:hypothetical protein